MPVSSFLLSAETKIIGALTGAGSITVAGVLGVFNPPARSSGRYAIRFECDGGDLTLGDGTWNHVIAIVGKRDASGAVSPVEVIGVAGMAIGGVAPQVPMRNKSGANPRSFTQVIELADGFAELGIAGLVGAETIAGATLSVYVSAILQ